MVTFTTKAEELMWVLNTDHGVEGTKLSVENASSPTGLV